MSNFPIYLILLIALYILAGIAYIHKSRQPAALPGGRRPARFLGIPLKVWLGFIIFLLPIAAPLFFGYEYQGEYFFNLLLQFVTPTTLLVLVLAIFLKQGTPMLGNLLQFGVALSIWLCVIWGINYLFRGFAFAPIFMVLPIGYTLIYIAYRFFQRKPAA